MSNAELKTLPSEGAARIAEFPAGRVNGSKLRITSIPRGNCSNTIVESRGSILLSQGLYVPVAAPG